MRHRFRVAIRGAAGLVSWLGMSAALLAQTPVAAPASGLTLGEAITRALAANPTIAAARLQRPIDVAGVAVARERPNPEVLYEASKETPRQAIGATLPLELGGKRQRRIDLATSTIALNEADLARVISDVRNEVRRAYFDAAAARLRVQIALDVQALAQRARDAANARVTAGDVPQSDLTHSDLALASSDNDVVAARGEADATRAELNVLIGQPAETTTNLSDALTGGAMLTRDEAFAVATGSNAELRFLDRRIAEQTARINLAKAMTAPDVAVSSTFTYDAEPEFQYGWRLAVSATVPVFTKHRAGVLVEESGLARLEGERAAAVTRMEGTIVAALLRATAARDQITRYQASILPLALESERQAQAAYSGGQTGLPALVQALQTARETRQRGVQAGLDYQHALADLERAIGASDR
jgi:outer membrane protein, heavy metal efflux system